MSDKADHGPAIEILLVEDNPGDVRLTREVLKEGRIHNTLNVVGDGAEALDFLRRRGAHADAKPQDLILLDLNLPKMNGREVLAAIKEDPDLKHVPVVVLTTSSAEADVLSAYELHANCYITKPVDLNQFVKVVQSIEDFWLSIVRLPGEAG
jgi:two-component system, chemotaxis family, response regulator Rcp1